jgi:hypothetical protein
VGIVVTIIMFLGVALLLRNSSLPAKQLVLSIWVLLLGGVWNALYYGLQHLNQFWGQAAFVSGLFMCAASGLLYLQMKSKKVSSAVRIAVMCGLLLCLLLYAVTLIQLNMGFEIIR